LLDETAVTSIHAPGHTSGSMIYLVDGQYLFTGDAFSILNGKISIHPFTMDKELAGKTIENLNDIISDSYLVLTAHYGSFEGGKVSKR